MLAGLVLVAAAPGARAGFDARRVPPLGDRGMPGRAGLAGSPPGGPFRRSRHQRRGVPGAARGTARRRPGSSPWWPSATAPWQPCRSPTCRGSAPLLRPRSGCTPERPEPRCARPCWPNRTGASHEDRHHPRRRAGPGGRVEVGVLARPWPAAEPGAAHEDPAAPAAAPRPRVRHHVGTVAAVGPAGGAAQVRPHPPLPVPAGAGRMARGCIRSCWAGRSTGTGCGCRWRNTCW